MSADAVARRAWSCGVHGGGRRVPLCPAVELPPQEQAARAAGNPALPEVCRGTFAQTDPPWLALRPTRFGPAARRRRLARARRGRRVVLRPRGPRGCTSPRPRAGARPRRSAAAPTVAQTAASSAASSRSAPTCCQRRSTDRRPRVLATPARVSSEPRSRPCCSSRPRRPRASPAPATTQTLTHKESPTEAERAPASPDPRCQARSGTVRAQMLRSTSARSVGTPAAENRSSKRT